MQMYESPMPNAEEVAVLGSYYKSGTIRARMLEFLGGSSLMDATAVYVVGSDGRSDGRLLEAQPMTQLFRLLAEGCEVERSLWTRRCLL